MNIGVCLLLFDGVLFYISAEHNAYPMPPHDKQKIINMCNDEVEYRFTDSQINTLIEIAKQSNDPEFKNGTVDFEEILQEIVEAAELVLGDIEERIEVGTHYIDRDAKKYAERLKALLKEMPQGVNLHLCNTPPMRSNLIQNELVDKMDEIIEAKIPHVEPWKAHLIMGVKHICRVGSLKFTTTPNSAARQLIDLLCESLNKDISESTAKELILKYKKNPKSLGLV